MWIQARQDRPNRHCLRQSSPKHRMMGLNRLVQGSSGDQAKQAMIDLDAEGYYLQIQVHDELGNTVEDEKEANWAAEIMENCVPCNVPHRVDVELGRSWGEAV